MDGDITARARRVFAFLLSLAAPGAGHFLLGAFRRGVAWAIGYAIVDILVVVGFFAMPVSLSTFLIAIAVALCASFAAALDTTRVASLGLRGHAC